jgi:ATP-binding cassette subfamily C protein/ATP-binding cassette subfamily C protein EexD
MRNKKTNPLKTAVKACKANIVTTIFFSLFINLLMFVAPIHMLQIYDRVLVSRSEVTLIVLTVLALGLLVIYGLLEAVRSRLLIKTGLRFDESVSDSLYRTVFKSSLRSANGTENVQALRDLNNLREFLSGSPIIAICDAPWVPIFIATGFFLHPVLGLVSLGGAIVIFILALVAEFSTKNLLREGATHQTETLNNVSASVRNAEIIQALGMIGTLKNLWQKSHDQTISYQAKASDRAALIMATSKFVRMSLQVLILGVGAYLAVMDEISPGTMIAASIIMGRALAPVEMAVGQWKVFVSTRSSYERVNRFFEQVPETAAPMQLPPPKGEIKVNQAVVVPPGSNQAVLKNVSFQLSPGTVLGVIGPSGSGKSSLARALVGVWPTINGSIRIDGAELIQWDPEFLGPFIGYMPQDVELFSGTVAENIARFQANDGATVVEAAQKAGVHDLVLTFGDGYDTFIGSNGKALSGGERQRIALARAVYGNPKILILDEPNANLDTVGELALSEAILSAKADGCSIIIISHKVSVLSTVDRLLVLRDGAVAMDGARDEVLKKLQPSAGVGSVKDA